MTFWLTLTNSKSPKSLFAPLDGKRWLFQHGWSVHSQHVTSGVMVLSQRTHVRLILALLRHNFSLQHIRLKDRS